jgi:hypothetical protein
VPQPDWQSFQQSATTIPDQCATSSSEVFGDASAPVVRLARNFRLPLAWRTNLAATTRLGPVRLGAEGVLSLNRFQSDLRDVNLIGTTRFRLVDEGSRPVFVDATRITDAGLFSLDDNRRSPSLGPVWIVGSGLKSSSRQLILSVQSANPTLLVRKSWQISYARLWITEERRGFEGSTVNDPSTIENSPGQFQSRHQILGKGSWVFGSSDQLEITGYLRLNSGFPFTPLVSSDINGDGLVNDRPWIVASGASGPRYVRDCLSKQVGGFARAQSCTGPWTVSSTLNLRVRGDVVRLPRRSRLTLSITNPMGLADRILHGNDLRGWGQLPVVDPYLYSVTGFDQGTKEFKYAVNPRFGSKLSARSITTNPFRLNIAVFIPVGPTWGAQSVETDLAPGRWRNGSRKTADEMTNEHIIGVIGFDPVSRIGQGRDSASYSVSQRKEIQSAISARDSALRSIFSSVAIVAARLGDHPTKDEKRQLLQLRKVATDSAVSVMITTGQRIISILTADQFERLSAGTKIFLNRPDILYLRRLQGFVY